MISCSSTQLKCPLRLLSDVFISFLLLLQRLSYDLLVKQAVFIKQDFGLRSGINQRLLLDGSVTQNKAAISREGFIILTQSLQLNYVTSLISVNVPESCI